MNFAVPAALILAFAATATVSVAAQADEKPAKKQRACFQVNDVAGWKEGEKHAFNLRTFRGDVYTSRMMGVCPEIDWTQKLAIKTRTSSFICEGDDAEVIVPHSTFGPQSCNIDQIRKMSKEEADKLEKRYRP